MRNIFICLFTLGVFLNLAAQKAPAHVGKVYTVVENRPQFIGGEMEMFKFLRDNVKYPKNSCKETGTVYYGFIVEPNGDLSHMEIKRSAGCAAYDAEGARVLALMSKGMWTAGSEKDMKVRVGYTLPIKFRLE